MPRLSIPKRVTPLSEQWRAEIDDYVNALAWSPDGRWLAVAAISGPITLYDADSGAVKTTLPGHSFGTSALSWHPGSTSLASAGQDGTVRLWGVVSGQEQQTLKAGAAWVERVAWSPISRSTAPLLASAAGRILRCWETNGQLVYEYSGHASTIADLQWKPRGRALATAAYGGVTLVAPESGEPPRRYEWKGASLALAWRPDGKYIATGDQDATVHFWNVATGQDLQMWGYETKVRELAWDHSSRYLATGGSAIVVVWDCSGKGPEGSKPLMLKGHTAPITALAFQPSGPSLASGGQDGTVIFWQPGRQRAPLGRLDLDVSIAQLAWSPDGKRVAVGNEDGTVVVATAP